MDSKYKNLAKNTVIFAIGNFSTKILAFLIVPLYTYVLTTEEYGRIDLFTTSISFLIPIITFSIQEALLRFLLGKEIDEKTAVSNCWLIYLVGLLISVLCYPIFYFYFKTHRMALLFLILLLMNSFNSIFTHYLRALGKNIVYTFKGIMETIILLFLNVFFLVVLKLGMMGYLYSMVCSQAAGIIYLCTAGKMLNKLNIKSADFSILKKMLVFSVPLIPNSMMWWIMSAGDKYIINYFLGDSANGLYSLALKIPTVITMCYSLFFQAWQMSAIEENNSSDRKNFYENIFKLTNVLLAGLIACTIVGIKPLYVLVMSEKFASAWSYVPILALATAFNCQSSFFGVVYTTSKRTSMAFGTTALGAVVNIFFNFLLIKPLGLQGVALGTCLGYITVCLVRARDTKREIGIQFDLKRTFMAVIILTIQCILTIILNDIAIICSGTIAIILLLVLYKCEIKMIIQNSLFLFKKKM